MRTSLRPPSGDRPSQAATGPGGNGPPPDPSGPGRGPLAAVLVAGVVLATAAGVLASGVGPLVAVVPVLAATALWAMAKVPLRWSAGALLFLVLSLEISSDAAGVWHSPLAIVGDLLQDSVGRVLGVPGLALSGLELLAVYLLAVAAYRGASRSTIDRDGPELPTASAIRGFLVLYLAGVLFAEGNGIVRGAGVAFWKVRHLLALPLLFLLFERAFRGPRALQLIGRVIVAAACVKAVLAVLVQRVIAPALTGGRLAHATNHGDSVLFAMALFLLVVDFTERYDLRSFARLAILAPPILLGMVANGRRTAWVMVGASLLAMFALSPWKRWKRLLTRTVLLTAPLIALYVAVGWDRSGTLFGPVAMFRTLSDASVDSSTRWRDVENWNIANSMHESPLAGIGLGREYTEFVKGDDISTAFKDFRGWPHNSVLGLLLFGGPFAFTAIWSIFAFTVFLAVRAYPRASAPLDRAAALACVAAVIVCAVLAFGDTGAHHAQYRVFTALALAVAGRLAVLNGAWPRRGGAAGAAGARPGGVA